MKRLSKSKWFRIISCMLLVAVLGLGGGLLAFLSDADTATNTFTVGKISIDLQEPNWNENNAIELTPNKEVVKDPQILNDGKNPAYVFLEVKVPYGNLVTANRETGEKLAATDTELWSYDVKDGWAEVGTPSKDSTSGYVTHLYVWGTRDNCTELAMGDTTGTLFDYVRFANVVEDEGLEEASKNIIINAYGIQTKNILDGKTDLDGANDDGKVSAEEVWSVLSTQVPSLEKTCTFTKENNEWANINNATYKFVQQDGYVWKSNNYNIDKTTAQSFWKLTVEEPTTYTLKYKVSSESSCDKLSITLNGSTIVNAISGESGEVEKGINLKQGDNILSAKYVKDSNTMSGEDMAYLILDPIESHVCSLHSDEKHAPDYSNLLSNTATCEEDGIGVYKCTGCDLTIEKPTAALGHDFEKVGSVYKCNRCGYETGYVYLVDGSTFNSKVSPKLSNYESAYKIVFTDEAFPTGIDTVDLSDAQDGTILGWLDGDTYKVSTGDSDIGIYANEDCSHMFENMHIVYEVHFDNFNTSKVVNMSQMFNSMGFSDNIKSSYSLYGLSTWDTSNVTDMSNMFNGFASDASTVSISGISNWNTSKVTNMKEMFYMACRRLNTFDLDLNSWDTSKVTDMSNMFYNFCGNAHSGSINISKWDVSNVVNMSGMFSGMFAEGLSSLDLSGWNTSKVENMEDMFSSLYCSTIYVSDLWNISNVTNSNKMFNNCNNLVGQSGIAYDEAKTDKTMANYETGYLTYKAPTIP